MLPVPLACANRGVVAEYFLLLDDDTRGFFDQRAWRGCEWMGTACEFLDRLGKGCEILCDTDVEKYEKWSMCCAGWVQQYGWEEKVGRSAIRFRGTQPWKSSRKDGSRGTIRCLCLSTT